MLDSFSEKISNEEYDSKIEYVTWRELKLYKESTVKLFQDTQIYPENILLFLHTKSDRVEWYHIPIKSQGTRWGAFGWFLYNNYKIEYDETVLKKLEYCKEESLPHPMLKSSWDNLPIIKQHTFVASDPMVIKPGESITFEPSGIYCNSISDAVSNIATSVASVSDVSDIIKGNISKLVEELNTLNEIEIDSDTVKKELNKKENDTMNTDKIINFDFGPAGSAFRLSPYGIAAHMGDRWIAYDASKSDVMDVEVFSFKVDNFIYKMPAPISALQPGDMIMHQKIPMFVRSVDNVAGTVEAINFRDCSVSHILPVKSPFGFNFVTKIVSLVDMSGMSPDADNPFGNMLPLLLLNNETDSNSLVPLMFMMNGKMDMSNPMMMYFLLKDSGGNDNNLLPLMLMMQMNK